MAKKKYIKPEKKRQPDIFERWFANRTRKIATFIVVIALVLGFIGYKVGDYYVNKMDDITGSWISDGIIGDAGEPVEVRMTLGEDMNFTLSRGPADDPEFEATGVYSTLEESHTLYLDIEGASGTLPFYTYWCKGDSLKLEDAYGTYTYKRVTE